MKQLLTKREVFRLQFARKALIRVEELTKKRDREIRSIEST